jgi:hypothetical protein
MKKGKTREKSTMREMREKMEDERVKMREMNEMG